MFSIISLAYILRVSFFVGVVLAIAAWADYSRTDELNRKPLEFRTAKPLVWFTLTTCCVWLLCLASIAWFGHRGIFGIGPRPYFPYNTPYMPFVSYTDLHVYSAQTEVLRTSAFWDPARTPVAWQYPPAMVMLYAVMKVAGNLDNLFFGIVAILVVCPAFALARAFIRRGLSPLASYAFVIATIVLSYPLWTELSLGNMEFFVVVIVALGVYSFLQNRTYAAATLFGFAAALKIFPFVYLALLLRRRQFRQLGVALATIVVAELAGLWLMGPGMRNSFRLVRSGLKANKEYYMLHWHFYETGIDHSGFGFIKQIVHGLTGRLIFPSGAVSIYLAIVAVTALSCWFLRIARLPVTNQIAGLCVISVVLPPTSHDYTLLHLYIPFALLALLSVRDTRLGNLQPGMVAVMVCFGALFGSESEIIVHGVSYGGQVKCLVLVLLFALLTRYPFIEGVASGSPARSLPA